MDPVYHEYLALLEDAMRQARALGLWRTTEQVHAALNEARSEVFEVTPVRPVPIDFKIGPVREQP